MAITFTGLTHNHQGSSSTPATPSLSPSSNGLILIAFTYHTAGTVADPNSVIGAGLTFAKIMGGQNFNGGVGNYVYRALSASPSSGAITIDASNLDSVPDAWQWQVVQFDGVSTSGSNGSGAIGNTNLAGAFPGSSVSTSITLSAGSASFGYNYAHGNGATITQGSGYTQYGPEDDTSTAQTAVEYKIAGSTTVDFSYSSTITLGVFGIEIVAPTASDTSAPWLRAMIGQGMGMR